MSKFSSHFFFFKSLFILDSFADPVFSFWFIPDRLKPSLTVFNRRVSVKSRSALCEEEEGKVLTSVKNCFSLFFPSFSCFSVNMQPGLEQLWFPSLSGCCSLCQNTEMQGGGGDSGGGVEKDGVMLVSWKCQTEASVNKRRASGKKTVNWMKLWRFLCLSLNYLELWTQNKNAFFSWWFLGKMLEQKHENFLWLKEKDLSFCFRPWWFPPVSEQTLTCFNVKVFKVKTGQRLYGAVHYGTWGGVGVWLCICLVSLFDSSADSFIFIQHKLNYLHISALGAEFTGKYSNFTHKLMFGEKLRIKGYC